MPSDRFRECLSVCAFGHNRPVTFSRHRPFERRHHSETCRMLNFSTSANAAVGLRSMSGSNVPDNCRSAPMDGRSACTVIYLSHLSDRNKQHSFLLAGNSSTSLNETTQRKSAIREARPKIIGLLPFWLSKPPEARSLSTSTRSERLPVLCPGRIPRPQSCCLQV